MDKSKATRAKWDRAAKNFDVMSAAGPEKRWGPMKESFFARMGEGDILFLAAGTGLDFAHFPPGRHITAIDISPKMLEIAATRCGDYQGELELREADVLELPFEDDSFDQVFTSCTFCSVPEPVAGLGELRRVLKPGGELHMLEHTGSRWFPFSLMLNVMTPLSNKFGPDMNRPTVRNVQRAGFSVDAVQNIYLDVVKTIHAHAP